MDQLEIEAHVTDEQGHPLVGSVVWYVGGKENTAPGTGLDSHIMWRMAKRYAYQSDFLDVDDLPGAVFRRTDLQGIYRDFREIGSVPGKRYAYIFVATKRGYLPQVVEGSAPLNQRHVVTLKLKPDPGAKPEPEMEEFDLLMAQARAPVPGEDLVGEARMHKLDELNRQVRALAQALEKKGLSEQASAVYWALADFPDVIRIKSPDGTTQIAGYRNGRTDPQSDADRAHAAQLNASVPKLLIKKLLANQGFTERGIHDVNKGQAYLKIFDQLASGPMGNQILPWEYEVAIYQNFRWSTPDKACEMLQRAYRFEPATMSDSKWWEFLDRVDRERAKLNFSGPACVIDGLPERVSNRNKS
jgi:hypothetical protein